MAQLVIPGMPPLYQPFLKWVGGKRNLLPVLMRRVPKTFGCYHEPFLGGGALFFHLKSIGYLGSSMLSDRNDRLICTYQAVQNIPQEVCYLLEDMEERHNAEPDAFFKITRDLCPETDLLKSGASADSAVAAWLIYLNRTCFNGLYRVNRKGKFNVPIGKPQPKHILDRKRILSCSEALQGVSVFCSDFDKVMYRCKEGDFVYFDPPYLGTYSSYDVHGFRDEDHEELRDVARELKGRGVHVLLSNSWTVQTTELYSDGFEIEKVLRPGTMNSNPKKRQKVEEALIW